MTAAVTTTIPAAETGSKSQQQPDTMDPRVEEFLKQHFSVKWEKSRPKVASTVIARRNFLQQALGRRERPHVKKAQAYWTACNAHYRAIQQEIIQTSSREKGSNNLWETSSSISSLQSKMQSTKNFYQAQDFQLIKKLGQGGYGSVFTARHVPTGHIVALKHIAVESSMIETKQQVLLPLRCGVVPCYGTFLAAAPKENPSDATTELHTWMVLKLCRKGSLKDRLNHTSQEADGAGLSQMEAAHILKKVSKIVSYLYENHGIVHNDIKADNILLDDDYDKDGSILLCDLGVSRRGEWQTRKMGGTFSHMAPEKLSARKLAGGRYHNDPSMDVWSMGVMLCEMLFDVYPFGAAPRALAKCTTLMAAYPEDSSSSSCPADDDSSHKIRQLTEECYTSANLNLPIENAKEDNYDDATDLLRRMLAVDPEQRLSLSGIKKHPFIVKRHGNWSDRAMLQMRVGLSGFVKNHKKVQPLLDDEEPPKSPEQQPEEPQHHPEDDIHLTKHKECSEEPDEGRVQVLIYEC